MKIFIGLLIFVSATIASLCLTTKPHAPIGAHHWKAVDNWEEGPTATYTALPGVEDSYRDDFSCKEKTIDRSIYLWHDNRSGWAAGPDPYGTVAKFFMRREAAKKYAERFVEERFVESCK